MPPVVTSFDGKVAPLVAPKVASGSDCTGVPTAPRYFSVGESDGTLSRFDIGTAYRLPIAREKLMTMRSRLSGLGSRLIMFMTCVSDIGASAPITLP